MKALKKILQVLASLVYTPIYIFIIYLIMFAPMYFILSLSTNKMILAIIVVGGILEGLIIFVQALGLIPYRWIVKDNKVSLYTSFALCVLTPLYSLYNIWATTIDYGWKYIFITLVLSGLLVQFVFMTIYGLVEMND